MSFSAGDIVAVEKNLNEKGKVNGKGTLVNGL